MPALNHIYIQPSRLSKMQFRLAKRLINFIYHDAAFMTYIRQRVTNQSNILSVTFQDEFIRRYSFFMAYTCIHTCDDTIFTTCFLAKSEHIVKLITGCDNIYHIRISKQRLLFVYFCARLLMMNLMDYGIDLERWEMCLTTEELFTALNPQMDSFMSCVDHDVKPNVDTVRTNNRLLTQIVHDQTNLKKLSMRRFELRLRERGETETASRSNSYDDMLEQEEFGFNSDSDRDKGKLDLDTIINNRNKILIEPSEVPVNDDVKECQLCFSESDCVCAKCKYPMCKNCLMKIMETGKCPCCQEEQTFKINVVGDRKNKLSDFDDEFVDNLKREVNDINEKSTLLDLYEYGMKSCYLSDYIPMYRAFMVNSNFTLIVPMDFNVRGEERGFEEELSYVIEE